MKVREVMHKRVDWVDPDTPVTDLAKLMRQHDIGAIPIGENDRLIGMVTDRDMPVINKSKRMIGILSLGDISRSAPSDLLSEILKSVSGHHH